MNNFKLGSLILGILLTLNLAHIPSYAQTYTSEDLMFRSTEQEGMAEEYIVLLSMTACAFISANLQESCSLMPTSMYYAASAGHMYLSGEALSLMSRYNTMDRRKIKDNLTQGKDSENQLKLALKLKKSLIQMKLSAQEKIKLQKSARSSYHMASTYALFRYRKQKDYLDECLSDTKSSVRKTNSIPTCGGCAKALSDARTMLINREQMDHTPRPSIDKYNQSKQVKKGVRDRMMSRCKNPLCLPGLEGSEVSCRTFRRVYFYNITYCDTRKLSTLGFNLFYDNPAKKVSQELANFIIKNAHAIHSWYEGLGIDDDKKATNEIIRLRAEATRFTDNWIAHPRGRALVFAAMEDLAERSVEVTENIIKNLEADIAQMEPMLKKLGAEGTETEGIVEELFGSGGMVLTKDGSSLPCLYKDCSKTSKHFQLRGAHIREMGKDFSKMTRSVGRVTDGLMKSRVSKATLAEAEKLGNSVARLDIKRKMIEKSLDNILRRRGKRPVQFDGYKKQFTNKILAGTKKVVKSSSDGAKGIFSRVFGGVASVVRKFVAPKKKEEKVSVAETPEKMISRPSERRMPGLSRRGKGYKYMIDINKDKHKSIWQIIHERYIKVTPTRLKVEE